MQMISDPEQVIELDSGLRLARPEKRFIPSYIDALKEGMNRSRSPTPEEEIASLQDDEEWRKWFLDTSPNHQNTESSCIEDMFWLTKQDVFIGFIVLRKDLGQLREKYVGNTGRVFRPGERNKGIGTIALEMTKELAKERGYSYIEMVTSAENIAARRPWEKCGAVLLEILDPSPESYYSGQAVKYRIQL